MEPMPKHLKNLATDHTEPIRKKLDSFENAIWLAYLRGKQAGFEKMPTVEEIHKCAMDNWSLENGESRVERFLIMAQAIHKLIGDNDGYKKN